MFFFAVALVLSACNQKSPTDERLNEAVEEVQTMDAPPVFNSIQQTQQYHDALTLGTLDLLQDPFFISKAIRLAAETYEASEQSDYFAYLDELAVTFEEANRNLLEEMIQSATNNGATEEQLALLRDNGLQYTFDNYRFFPRLFLPGLDELDYSKAEDAARLSFSKMDGGTVPVWNRTAEGSFSRGQNANAQSLTESPVWLVSSRVLDTTKDMEVDMLYIEAGGKKKCKKSKTTGACSISGKKCKCYYGPADGYAREINNFINGTIEEDFYIVE